MRISYAYRLLSFLASLTVAILLPLENSVISLVSALCFVYVTIKLEKTEGTLVWVLYFLAFIVYFIGAIFNPVIWIMAIIAVLSGAMGRTP